MFPHTRNRYFRKSGAILIFFGVLQTGWMTEQFFCRLLLKKLDYVDRILKCKWCCGDSFQLPAAILCEDDRETSRCSTNLKDSKYLNFNIRCTKSNVIKYLQKKHCTAIYLVSKTAKILKIGPLLRKCIFRVRGVLAKIIKAFHVLKQIN